MPYYIMDVTATVPCLPGLFVAGVFSAALRYSISWREDSSVSTGAATFLNYLVTVSHNLESCRLIRHSTERGEGTIRNKQKSRSIRVESCETSMLYAYFQLPFTLLFVDVNTVSPFHPSYTDILSRNNVRNLERRMNYTLMIN